MTPLRFVTTSLSSAVLWGTSAIAYGAEPAAPATPGPAAPVIEAPPEAPKATESTPAEAAHAEPLAPTVLAAPVAPAKASDAPQARVPAATDYPAPPMAAAAPSMPPPSADAGAATVLAGVPIRLTGTLHAMVIGTQGVQTFGQANASAPTSAQNPALVPHADDPHLSFQVQQTRLGMVLGEGTDFRGQVEVDFIHFDQSSPTTLAYPRLRIASIEWHFAPKQRLFLGQTWDLFGNTNGSLLSHSMNLVGTLFQAGNIGFMRQQAGWSGRFGDVELAAAAGLQGANNGPSFNNIEQSATPTGSARVMVHLGENGVVGASALATSLRFSSGSDLERRTAAGGQLFADLSLGPINLRAEAYIAQNLANLGALNLGQGRFGQSVADAGGYVSARANLGNHAVTAMAGGAAVLRPSDVVPGYTSAAKDANGAVTSPAAANTAAGPGMTYNMTAHVGYWYSPLKGLSFIAEPYAYLTRFAMNPGDQTSDSAIRVALGGSIGSIYQF